MRKILTLILISVYLVGSAQKYDAAYVHALYTKYPTVKSNLCSACKEWDNPIFKSIADTFEHRPVVTFYVYTNEHRLLQEKNTDSKTGIYSRKGIFAEWHPVTGQPDLSKVYSKINEPIKSSINKWVWGHCQAWILLAWCQDGAILSDTEDFNEGMEVQGQNIGTEIATEEHCRDLLQLGKTASVKIWCGTWGHQGTATDGKNTVVIPSHYWKIIQYTDSSNKIITESWWMPNEVTETIALLPKRMSTPTEIIKNIGFDPSTIFQ